MINNNWLDWLLGTVPFLLDGWRLLGLSCCRLSCLRGFVTVGIRWLLLGLFVLLKACLLGLWVSSHLLWSSRVRLLGQKLSMNLLQRLNEILFVISIAFFNVVHNIKHRVHIQAVCYHELEEFSDSVVHSLVDLFEFVSSLDELVCVVVWLWYCLLGRGCWCLLRGTLSLLGYCLLKNWLLWFWFLDNRVFYFTLFDWFRFDQHAQELSTCILIQLQSFIDLIKESLVEIRFQFLLLDKFIHDLIRRVWFKHVFKVHNLIVLNLNVHGYPLRRRLELSQLQHCLLALTQNLGSCMVLFDWGSIDFLRLGQVNWLLDLLALRRWSLLVVYNDRIESCSWINLYAVYLAWRLWGCTVILDDNRLLLDWLLLFSILWLQSTQMLIDRLLTNYLLFWVLNGHQIGMLGADDLCRLMQLLHLLLADFTYFLIYVGWFLVWANLGGLRRLVWIYRFSWLRWLIRLIFELRLDLVGLEKLVLRALFRFWLRIYGGCIYNNWVLCWLLFAFSG